MSRKLVVDSSVFIALSRRGTLEQYLKQKKDEGYEVLIPRAIARELLYDPKRLAEEISEKSPVLAKKIMQSVEAIDAAIGHGLIRVETVNYRKYSRVADNVRKHLSQLEAMKEHTVKKGDPEIIVLIIQLHDKFKERISVSTNDKGLLRTLRAFRNVVEYEVLNH
jgi:rRNA-processing protein FCF1